MNIPKPLLQLGLNFALQHAGSVVAAPLEKVPHIGVVAKAYVANEPLEVIIGLYLEATKMVADDQIAAKVGEIIAFVNIEIPKILSSFSLRPAKDVIGELLGKLTVPDFDNTVGNEKQIVAIFNDAMSELAK